MRGWVATAQARAQDCPGINESRLAIASELLKTQTAGVSGLTPGGCASGATAGTDASAKAREAAVHSGG